jgi:CAAX prenyl protease-like protein
LKFLNGKGNETGRGAVAAARFRDVALIAPYAVWMALMMLLPHDAPSYALRVAFSAAALAGSWFALGRPRPVFSARCWFGGIAAGIAVFFIWIAPEYLGFGTGAIEGDSPFDPAVCGWPLTLTRLLGSALVITAAEELFFRRWLMDFAGFWWMVALFAVEHDRWAVGAAAGAIYGFLALRSGLLSAVIAHVTTNLVLGLWVVGRGAWQFW